MQNHPDIVYIRHQNLSEALTRKISCHQEILRGCIHDIAIARRNFRTYKRLYKLAKQLQKNPVPNATEFVSGIFALWNYEPDYTIPSFTAWIEDYTRRYHSHASQSFQVYRVEKQRKRETSSVLASLEQQAARERLSGTTAKVDLNKLKKDFESHPHVKELRIEMPDSGVLKLFIKFTELEMRPVPHLTRLALRLLEDVEGNLNQHIDIDPAIPLDDFTVSIEIPLDNPQHVIFRAEGGTFLPAYGDDFLVHPHWIAYDRPCLGDFQKPIYEAIAAGNLDDAIYLLIMFLQIYNPEDSAGKYFPIWRIYVDNPDLGRAAKYNPFYDLANELIETYTNLYNPNHYDIDYSYYDDGDDHDDGDF